MRFANLPLSFLLPLFPLLGLVTAQDQNSTSTYVQECVDALQSAGFTALAHVITTVSSTESGKSLFYQLSSGNNYTLFAPDNNAIQAVPASVSGNSSLLAEYLSYHVVSGDFKNESYGGGGSTSTSSSTYYSSTSTSRSASRSSSRRFPTSTASYSNSNGPTYTVTATATPSGFAALFGRFERLWNNPGNSSGPQPYSGIWPKVTIGRTLLNAPQLVKLPASKSQVLVWTKYQSNGNVFILNQGRRVSVTRSTTWRNLFINGITGVLTPPGKLSNVLDTINASTLKALLSAVRVPSSRGGTVTALAKLQSARGVTVFVPNNAAFRPGGPGKSNWNSPTNQTNQTSVIGLLENHYLNSTVLYSTLIANNSRVTTAGGEPLQFRQDSSGGIVIIDAKGTSARIVQSDVLLENGVAHVIDRVLFVEDVDPSAASQAYGSATASAAAASGSTETGPIGIGGGYGGPTVTATLTSYSSYSTSFTTASSTTEPSSSRFSSSLLSSSFFSLSSAPTSESSTTTETSTATETSTSSVEPSTTESSTTESSTTVESTTVQSTVTVTGSAT
ncbi:hypothetical protein GALMADRAFT_228341 [Galerina marginata CBS 339.88]|uniref:FAS1 domain-containing protein n=1 Tax=Galerina marginata (strain CBS 339.88) TaxID=685588 RepID=A0A067T2I2_GALM3|nr:hypothetical protein GALMADRAFT_228341 [Galerina marginata CBS 339.88]